MSEQPAPTLKLIVVDPTNPHVLRKLQGDLAAIAGAGEVRAIFGNVYLVNTAIDTSELRDLVAGDLSDRDSVIVVEFETWSGYGPGIDGTWLMRCGH